MAKIETTNPEINGDEKAPSQASDTVKQESVKSSKKSEGLFDEIICAIDNAIQEVDHALAGDLHALHVRIVELKNHASELAKKDSKKLKAIVDKLLAAIK